MPILPSKRIGTINTAILLTLSAWHFGDDWSDLGSRLEQLIGGTAIILMPVVFHKTEVREIFHWLSRGEDVRTLVDAMYYAGLIVLPLSIFLALAKIRCRSWMGLEILSIVVIAALAPPLLFFAAYFCLLHSPRHLVRTVGLLKLSTPLIISAIIGFTLGAVLLASMPFIYGVEFKNPEGISQVIFIGLLVLTVPHMLLIHKCKDT